MELEITLPEALPVMTLPNMAFFPQALLPLHIFEPRYRQMLKDVLASDRLFAVAGLNDRLVKDPLLFEPSHRVASVGIVRACQENSDGTSNLLLQGLCRVEFIEVVSDEPYRRAVPRLLTSAGGVGNDHLGQREELARLLRMKQKLGAPMPKEITDFLRKVEDPETYVDLAAFSLCDNAAFKQKLLETLDIGLRLDLFNQRLRGEIEHLRLSRKLQGRLADDRIANN
jgi:Lon protease-like protein